ncbi:MAG: hypothetical protein AAB901_01230 [Patescibacteria group bacterium]
MWDLSEVSDLFFFAATIGVVVITLTIFFVGYQLVKVLEEIRPTVRIIRAEAEALAHARKEAVDQVRFMLKWMRLFPKFLFRR